MEPASPNAAGQCSGVFPVGEAGCDDATKTLPTGEPVRTNLQYTIGPSSMFLGSRTFTRKRRSHLLHLAMGTVVPRSSCCRSPTRSCIVQEVEKRRLSAADRFEECTRRAHFA